MPVNSNLLQFVYSVLNRNIPTTSRSKFQGNRAGARSSTWLSRLTPFCFPFLPLQPTSLRILKTHPVRNNAYPRQLAVFVLFPFADLEIIQSKAQVKDQVESLSIGIAVFNNRTRSRPRLPRAQREVTGLQRKHLQKAIVPAAIWVLSDLRLDFHGL